MNPEQFILDAVERGKALGYAEGMRAMRVKELTDEEILKEAESYGMGEKFIQDAPLFHAIQFAKAILRKAQEK